MFSIISLKGINGENIKLIDVFSYDELAARQYIELHGNVCMQHKLFQKNLLSNSRL